ncbi:MAG TPA: hypothetical protein VEC58_02655 [Roseiarcus sp.]|nr:hypothetical protein [Roseiarcus sp.]
MARLTSWRLMAATLGLAGLGAFVSAALAEQSPPLGSGAHFRAIKIDLSGAAQYGGAPAANWAAAALPSALQEAFSGRVEPGDRSAPTLIVRIDRILLGPSGNGGGASSVSPDQARDYIEGAGVVVGANGQTLGVYPLLDAVYNYTGGANYEADSGPRRVGVLARSFAEFLPGKMGL